MLSQKSPIPTPPLPYPPTPPFWPWCSPVLGHIKFASPMGLSFQWWPTRPSLIHMQLETRALGYWLVYIVVPPIGLQFPLVRTRNRYFYWEALVSDKVKQVSHTSLYLISCGKQAGQVFGESLHVKYQEFTNEPMDWVKVCNPPPF